MPPRSGGPAPPWAGSRKPRSGCHPDGRAQGPRSRGSPPRGRSVFPHDGSHRRVLDRGTSTGPASPGNPSHRSGLRPSPVRMTLRCGTSDAHAHLRSLKTSLRAPEVRRLVQRRHLPNDPVRHPVQHRLQRTEGSRNARTPAAALFSSAVSASAPVILGSTRTGRELLDQPPHRDRLRPGHVQHRWWRARQPQRPQRDGVGVTLPDHVDVAHRDVDASPGGPGWRCRTAPRSAGRSRS